MHDRDSGPTASPGRVRRKVSPVECGAWAGKTVPFCEVFIPPCTMPEEALPLAGGPTWGLRKRIMPGRLRTAFQESFRVLHVLTLEVLGAFFLALAILGGADTVRQYQMYTSDAQTGVWRVALALMFTLLTLAFGVQSFWKVRRIRK